jgi:ribosomal protein L7/L12
MGRKKIRIESIENERQKMVTFSRRRAGLIKKAHELAVLCDCKIALLIFDRTDNCHLFSSDQQAEELLKRYQERDDIQKRCMIDCLNEDEASTMTAEDDEEEEEIKVAMEQSKESKPEVTAVVRGRRKNRASYNAIKTLISSSPATNKQQPSNLLEYVVDQKGVGSESLVVKSATIGKNSGQNSCTGGSRRNSLAGRIEGIGMGTGVMSKKSIAATTTNYSPFNPVYNNSTQPQNTYTSSYSPAPTTQSHQLFPNYPRTALPTLETQFDLNLMSNDLGLATLNANDFNLMGIWNNSNNNQHQQQFRSYFDIIPQSSFIQQQQHQQPQQVYQSVDTPRYMNQHPSTISATSSQNPINNLVSDLFGDISTMF